MTPTGLPAFGFTYDGAGRRTSLTYPTGSTAAYTYDARGRLTSLTHTSSTGSTIASFTYTYDKTMHRLTKDEPDLVKQHTYTYDGVYRLTHSVPTPLDPASNDMRAEDFTHDAVGNRLTGPDSIETYTYDADNRLLSLQLSTPLTTAEDHTYTYDYENRLVQVDKVVGGVTTTVKFKYDPFGRRIQKRVSTTQNGQNVVKTYIYIYDREDVIIERLSTTIGSGAPTVTTKKYVHGPGVDEPLAVAKGGNVYYYHADGLGSIVALTDWSEATVEGYSYDTFGRVERFGNAVQNTYGFTGREYDIETGLYYYRSRYYDPQTGRFISKDPIGFAGGDANLYNYVDIVGKPPLDTNLYSYVDIVGKPPIETNLYQYAGNDPINLIDPLGLWYIDIGYSGSAIGSLGPGGTVGIKIGPSGLYFYYGFGLGYKGGASATINTGDPTEGVSVTVTARGGYPIYGIPVGAKGSVSINQDCGVSKSVGVGFGFGFGVSVTATQTVPVVRW